MSGARRRVPRGHVEALAARGTRRRLCHIGDYAMWFTVGLAAFGGLFILAVR